MPKKRRRKRRIGGMGIKTGAKALEKKIAAKARKLKDDPTLLLPVGCEKAFISTRRALEKVQSVAEDENRLRAFSKKGDSLSRAYAATLLLLHSDISPTFAVVHLQHREVSIVYWGKTPKEKIIGVQYYDDPVLRLYGVLDIAKRKRVWIYSMDQHMVCSGRTPKPPDGFVGVCLSSFYKDLKREEKKKKGVEDETGGDRETEDMTWKRGNVWRCRHLYIGEKGKTGVEKGLVGGARLFVGFHSTGERVEICERCVSDSVNSAGILMSRIAGPKVERDITARVVFASPPYGDELCPDDIWKSMLEGTEVAERYIKGRISDKKAFFDTLGAEKKRVESLGLYVAGGRVFSRWKEMLDALSPGEVERKALEAAFSKREAQGAEGLVLDNMDVSSLLSVLWGEYGEVMVGAVVGMEKASEIYKEGENAENLSFFLRKAVEEKKSREILGRLPSYKNLPPIADLSDTISRIYRVEGKEGVLRHIRNMSSGDTRTKSTAYAFLLALGMGESEGWRFTPNEKEFADFLMPFAKSLLHASPEEYDEKLRTLVQATGSGENVPHPRPSPP